MYVRRHFDSARIQRKYHSFLGVKAYLTIKIFGYNDESVVKSYCSEFITTGVRVERSKTKWNHLFELSSLIVFRRSGEISISNYFQNTELTTKARCYLQAYRYTFQLLVTITISGDAIRIVRRIAWQDISQSVLSTIVEIGIIEFIYDSVCI